MDSSRFDNMARRIARGSRREFLKGIVSGLAGIAGGVAIAGDASARRRGRGSSTSADGSVCAGDAVTCGGTCCQPGESCCADSCCPIGQTCCGEMCCPDDQCSDNQVSCCAERTVVCGAGCCEVDQNCCDGECCWGECFDEELCCPAPRLVCNGSCCEEDLNCCSTDGCCAGTCVGSGQICCQAGVGSVCGDECCVYGVETCCSDQSGASTCVAPGSCCDDSDCAGIGVCSGTCNSYTRQCDYPLAELSCGEQVCSSDGLVQIQYSCDGSGGCAETSTPCGDPGCKDGECQVGCVSGDDCSSQVCEDNGVCCPDEYACIDQFCCLPDPERPGVACCPVAEQCCDCFVDREGFPFCCGDNGTYLCESPDGDFRNDQCYDASRYTCVAGVLALSDYVCNGNVVCDTPCCNGACCADGTVCSGGSCQIVESYCEQDSDCSTERGEICATAGGSSGSCCPAHRAYRNRLAEESGAPIPYWECCGATEEAEESCDGNPFCRMIPDVTCTSVYSWGRR